MHGNKSNTSSTFPPTTSPPLKGQIRDTPLFVVWTCHFCLYLYYYASATAKTNYHPFIKTTCITTLSKVLDSTFVKFHRTHIIMIMNTLLQCLDCKKQHLTLLKARGIHPHICLVHGTSEQGKRPEEQETHT